MADCGGDCCPGVADCGGGGESGDGGEDARLLKEVDDEDDFELPDFLLFLRDGGAVEGAVCGGAEEEDDDDEELDELDSVSRRRCLDGGVFALSSCASSAAMAAV